jgi:hypothetical protein
MFWIIANSSVFFACLPTHLSIGLVVQGLASILRAGFDVARSAVHLQIHT